MSPRKSSPRIFPETELYYEVWVSSPRFHGQKPLTYQFTEKLEIGTIVTVPMQKQIVVGVVLRSVSKPAFSTKDIVRLVSHKPLPEQFIRMIDWLRAYYPASLGALLSLIVPSVLTIKSRQNEDKLHYESPQSLPKLTKEQKETCQNVRAAYPKNVLLHGDTGTGKTRVYLELAAEHLENGRSVLLLTPEIGLTPQLATICAKTFPEKTVVLHSELSSATRRKTWLKILEADESLIVIGPRSALFAPLRNIGLVIIDEFHENAYKQEQTPYYVASRVGAKLAELHEAQLLLGSATPLIADYFAFEQKGLPIVRMKEPAIKHLSAKPEIVIVDLKKKELFTHSPWLSDSLLQAIEQACGKKQQSLIFLNRRGTARITLCKVCGWQAFCPRCDLPLTYHGDKHNMQCHTCGYTARSPSICPDCGTHDIIFRSIGTKFLVDELQHLFPDEIIKRFDSDNILSEKLEKQYAAVERGDVSILVGTQILGKGLDLPRLSVLGIVMADVGLTFPDYTSEERTFQLLNQAIGRIHRGHVEGTAFVQTYHIDNPVLLAAINNNYRGFYVDQLTERKKYSFPPFRFLMKLTCSRASSASAQQASLQLATQLRNSKTSVEIIGPVPAFVEKVHNRYKWQLILKSSDRSELVKLIKELPANWSYDIDPINLL